MSNGKMYFSLVVVVILIYSSISIFFIRASKNIVDTTCENALVDYLHLSLNDVLRFDSEHNAKHIGRWFGWYSPESWGTWSNGGPSFLYLNVEKAEGSDVCLLINGWSALSKKHPRSRVKITVNGSYVGKFTQTLENPSVNTYIRIPYSAIKTSSNGNLVIKLLSLDPSSPFSSGENPDTRILGFGITSLQLVHCGP